MELRTKISTPASDLLISLDDLKNQLNYPLTDTSKDAQFTVLIKAAVSWAQGYCGRIFLDSELISYLYYISGDKIELTRGPITEITSIKYYDAANELQTLSSDLYSLDNTDTTSYIQFSDEFEELEMYERWDAVQITYRSGWVNAAAVPEDIKIAVTMHAARLYTHPDDGVNERATISERMLNNYIDPRV